jgi:GcrA cell cycle regulator
MDWNSESVDKLKELWQAGLSITKIGIKLGTTRNAVVGKAHRIGLTRRPAAVAPPARALGVSAGGCKWPIGDPKSPDFTYCGDSALPDHPYCAKHCALAYANWEERSRSANAA